MAAVAPAADKTQCNSALSHLPHLVLHVLPPVLAQPCQSFQCVAWQAKTAFEAPLEAFAGAAGGGGDSGSGGSGGR